MNCEQACELMSAYFDGELESGAGGTRDEVRDHLAACIDCAGKLRSFEQIRLLASSQKSGQRVPPPWEMIAVRLVEISSAASSAGTDHASIDGTKSAVSILQQMRNRRLALGGLLALAASAILFFSLRGTSPHESRSTNQASVATLDLQPFMELFNTDSDKAMATLASQHPTTDVTLATAEAEFGRPTFVQRSASSNSLPGKAQLVSTKLVQFPYCKCPKGACTCGPGGCSCVACVCQRPDGSTYLVLEHCKSQSVTFGSLPVQIVRRKDRDLMQVEADGTTAISWEQNGERLTAIGLRGFQEIDTLIANN